jgi:hypothetical protein
LTDNKRRPIQAAKINPGRHQQAVKADIQTGGALAEDLQMAYLADQVAGSPAVLFSMMNSPVCIAVDSAGAAHTAAALVNI